MCSATRCCEVGSSRACLVDYRLIGGQTTETKQNLHRHCMLAIPAKHAWALPHDNTCFCWLAQRARSPTRDLCPRSLCKTSITRHHKNPLNRRVLYTAPRNVYMQVPYKTPVITQSSGLPLRPTSSPSTGADLPSAQSISELQ